MTMSRPRIIILQDKLRGGGTERNSIWLANQFHHAGWQSHLVVFERPDVSVEGIDAPVSYLRGRSILGDWYAPRLISCLRELGPAVVICMGRNANSYGCWIRARLRGVKIVTTCRTNRRLPFFYRHSIRRSDCCLVNSQWAADQLIAAGLIGGERVRVIPNPLIRTGLLALDNTADAKETARQRLDLAAGGSVLCCVAHFVPGKNQTALLRIFKASRSCHAATLVLAGDGPTRPHCEHVARELGLSSRVRFLGQTESIEDVLAASDLLVSAALRESLPNIVVEAQAAGLPVIAFDTAGTSEAMLPGSSGLIIPQGDETAFAEALDELLNDNDRRASFAEKAREYARDRFDPAAVFSQFQDAVVGLEARRL